MQSSECPSCRALATWRCSRNHSNHCGNSVKTSIRTEEALPQDDPPLREVDRLDRVVHERHHLPVLGLEHLARGVGEQPRDAPDALDLAADEVVRPVLVLLE